MLETRRTAIKLTQNRAVEVTLYRAGEELNIKVSKELIICAGAIQSPHLVLSGIGDGDALPVAEYSLGITCQESATTCRTTQLGASNMAQITRLTQ